MRITPGSRAAAVLLLLIPCVSTAQTTPVEGRAPDFQIEIVSEYARAFDTRVQGYFELRDRLAKGLPALTITDDVAEIHRHARSLAAAIRRARPGAVQGEFFTAATSAEFKTIIDRQMNAMVLAVIMDENPGAFHHHIDGPYPRGKTLGTMPPEILARLPRLPADIQFRFIGPNLILYDVRANTIMDRLPDAISWASQE